MFQGEKTPIPSLSDAEDGEGVWEMTNAEMEMGTELENQDDVQEVQPVEKSELQRGSSFKHAFHSFLFQVRMINEGGRNGELQSRNNTLSEAFNERCDC